MSRVKQFHLSPTFRSAANRSLVRHLPSDLLYTFGAALYDKANRVTLPPQRDMYRKACDRVLAAVKSIRALEEQYYGF